MIPVPAPQPNIGASADVRATVGWLHRRAGFGLHPYDLDRIANDPVAASDPVGSFVAEPDRQQDPWTNVDLLRRSGGRVQVIRAWLARFVATTSPYRDRRTFMLHGWLVSALDKVRIEPMVAQVRLLMESGGGPYPELLEAITVDRAMLVYLDGATSTAAAPNENFGRELLELFALGVGNAADGSEQTYTEDDVIAASRALTGWTFRTSDSRASLVPRRHDSSPQTLLGSGGVNNVESVIDAVVAHPEHARFVARRIVREYVGDAADPRLDGVVEHLATIYLENGMRLDATIEEGLRLAHDGAGSPIVLAPLPWLMLTARVLGAPAARVIRVTKELLREAGQIPMFAPSVEGWPHGAEWFTSSSLVARTQIADRLVAQAEPFQPAVVAADDGDFDELAIVLGLREPFGPTTTAALRGAADTRSALTLALVSPESLLS